jgi:hypothetical protein
MAVDVLSECKPNTHSVFALHAAFEYVVMSIQHWTHVAYLRTCMESCTSVMLISVCNVLNGNYDPNYISLFCEKLWERFVAGY